MNDDLEAMDGLCAKVIEQRDRIEALEAALRTIRDDGKNCVDHCRRQADKALRISARAAGHSKDTGK